MAKRKMFRVQQRPEEGKRNITEEAAKGENKVNLREDLQQLVNSTPEGDILEFAAKILAIPRFKSRMEVLEYMQTSASSDQAVMYFIKELNEFLGMKPKEREPEEEKPSRAPDEDEDPTPVPKEEQEWDQGLASDKDPMDFMTEHFAETKERLGNMVDRITICEGRLDEHAEQLNELELNPSKAGEGVGPGDLPEIAHLGKLLNSMVVKIDELEKKVADVGGGTTGEYVIKFSDGKEKKLIGKVFPPIWGKLLDLATTRSNIFLAGPTQCGKTYTAQMVAEALDLRFSALSCSEGMDEGMFTGRLLPLGENGKFIYMMSVFVDFYENGGVFLFDEFCASDSNLGVFVNNALSNDHFYLQIRHENTMVKRHKDFICIAADNTFGHGGDDMYIGRNQMDASTMERFRTGFLVMDYSAEVEKSICDEDIYRWCFMIRKAITALKMSRAMSTRTMKEFTKMKRERNWKITDCEKIYFADWPKDDVKRVMNWVKQDIEKSLRRA